MDCQTAGVLSVAGTLKDDSVAALRRLGLAGAIAGQAGIHRMLADVLPER